MDKTKILQELFDNDFATKEIEIIPGKLSVKVRNIGFDAQADLEKLIKQMKDQDMTTRQFVQFHAKSTLARTLLSWGDTKFDTWDQWEEFLQNKSVSVIDKVIIGQQKFEKEVRKALDLDNVEETFSLREGQTDALAPSQKESTSEEEEA